MCCLVTRSHTPLPAPPPPPRYPTSPYLRPFLPFLHAQVMVPHIEHVLPMIPGGASFKEIIVDGDGTRVY